MKLLITGTNGLLGQKLVSQLEKETFWDVLATSRGESRLGETAIRYQSMDIENREDVLQTVAAFAPDVILHTAAMTHVDQCELNREACWRANVEAVQHLIAAAEQCGAFLLHVSTDFIFSGEEGPYSEEATPAPVNFYGESKLEAERLVQGARTPWAIARTVLVYGITNSLSRSNIIVWVKNSLESGKAIQVVDDQWRTPTLAEDLAAGCLLIARQKAEGIWNISGKDFLSPLEMAQKTADFFGLDSSLISRADSSTFTQPARRPPRTGFTIQKAQSQLGYQPHSFEEGLALVARQIKQLQ
ncbi:SDR family oxidoreductase [Cesiribacter andamanensis]|uniref:dTDP-4-dehydrorhamnose reductase n=1 Tax=Cesiribacter andamanensis AMV16 TaxID=1279009 RepID=M7NAC2_9BACT|nr:SDR family oxidoreductase [Cesiribacter andamanensis]EMR04202.1 dTDP-4-dehydrorhamnose reductase [Cesiribacter andamanensis AMV16]